MMILFDLSLALNLVYINDNLFSQNMVEFGQSYPLQYGFLVVSYVRA